MALSLSGCAARHLGHPTRAAVRLPVNHPLDLALRALDTSRAAIRLAEGHLDAVTRDIRPAIVAVASGAGRAGATVAGVPAVTHNLPWPIGMVLAHPAFVVAHRAMSVSHLAHSLCFARDARLAYFSFDLARSSARLASRSYRRESSVSASARLSPEYDGSIEIGRFVDKGPLVTPQ
jgi:hypothetical protein